jgi:hypothetical protein
MSLLLFVLWAIRGSNLLADRCLISFWNSHPLEPILVPPNQDGAEAKFEARS